MRHELFVLLVCVLSFLTHLTLVTEVSENIFHNHGICLRHRSLLWAPQSLRLVYIDQIFCDVFKLFSLNLPTSGRNLRLPSHWLLRHHQSVSEFYDYFWMSCYWLDFWWARLLLLKKKSVKQYMFLYSCYCQHLQWKGQSFTMYKTWTSCGEIFSNGPHSCRRSFTSVKQIKVKKRDFFHQVLTASSASSRTQPDTDHLFSSNCAGITSSLCCRW